MRVVGDANAGAWIVPVSTANERDGERNDTRACYVTLYSYS